MRPFILTATTATILSLLSMWLGETFLGERVALIGSFAGLTLSHNPGIAFGIRLPAVFQELLIVGALAWMTVLAIRSASSLWHRVGFGFIVGGALGNLIDRFIDGVVTDYFQVGTFPIFNVADSFITVGVLFLLADAFGMVRNKR
jgi:signal peptidase II